MSVDHELVRPSPRPLGSHALRGTTAIQRLAPRSGLWLALLVAALAAAVGAALTAGAWLAGAAILIAAIPPLVLCAERMGFYSIVAWVIVEGIATPFLRYPQQHTIFTFDRIWIPVMAIGLLGLGRGLTHARVTRQLGAALGLLVLYVGARATFTAPAGPQRYALELWIDALVLPAILYFVVRRGARGSRQTHELAGAFLVAGVILSAIVILEKVVGFELATRSGGAVFVDPAVGVRYSGPYAQPDMLAVALLLCLAMTLLWTQLKGQRRLLWGVSAICLELVGLWLTYFRGAWVAALLVLIVSLGLRPRRYARLLGMLGLVAVIGFAAIWNISENGSDSGLSARITNAQNVSGRLATYEQGVQIFEEHPIFGVGVAKYADAQETVESVSVGGVRSVTTAHNTYMDVLVEDGLPGIVALLFLSIAILRLLRRLRRSGVSREEVVLAACMTAAVLAYFIMAMEETVILQGPPNTLLAVCLGLGAARLDAILARGSTPERIADQRQGA